MREARLSVHLMQRKAASLTKHGRHPERATIVLLTNSAPPEMPIRLPDAESIRRQIAEAAAALREESPAHYLPLLGRVEPTWPPTTTNSPWRLSSYIGPPEDSVAIERAVGVVQRRSPLMRVD